MKEIVTLGLGLLLVGSGCTPAVAPPAAAPAGDDPGERQPLQSTQHQTLRISTTVVFLRPRRRPSA